MILIDRDFVLQYPGGQTRFKTTSFTAHSLQNQILVTVRTDPLKHHFNKISLFSDNRKAVVTLKFKGRGQCLLNV